MNMNLLMRISLLPRSFGKSLGAALLALLFCTGCVSTPEEKLRTAAMEGYLIRVERLVLDGVSPQAVDQRGVTPLQIGRAHV